MSVLRRWSRSSTRASNIAGAVLALGRVGALVLGVTGGLIGLGAHRGAVRRWLFGRAARARACRIPSMRDQDADNVRSELRTPGHQHPWPRGRRHLRARPAASATRSWRPCPRSRRGYQSPIDPNVHLIRQTALAYLPQALDAYLALPRIYAERRAVADGQTPHDVLLEQLSLMDSKMHERARGHRPQRHGAAAGPMAASCRSALPAATLK